MVKQHFMAWMVPFSAEELEIFTKYFLVNFSRGRTLYCLKVTCIQDRRLSVSDYIFVAIFCVIEWGLVTCWMQCYSPNIFSEYTSERLFWENVVFEVLNRRGCCTLNRVYLIFLLPTLHSDYSILYVECNAFQAVASWLCCIQAAVCSVIWK